MKDRLVQTSQLEVMMERDRFKMAVLFPLLAAVIIICFAGGLGITFMVLNEQVVEEWAVVAVGMSLVIGVPTVASLLERKG